ncbi:6940_t:CDS:2 [Diversispora eburnea]|uniref:Purine nucleoside phosphorylase n=1 Tax=Diversispora eburnea TaxID=1213867 RepID=A0A9N9A2N2_9GLOM|nr:6940_t:CDS:2 [Diversispora eburnea]
MPPQVSNGETDELFTVTADYLRKRLTPELSQPKVAIICGSGLGGLVDTLEETDKVEFLYEEIPGFVSSTVPGHAGKLAFGLLGENKMPTVIMVGRFHFYEGYNLNQITFPIRIFKLLGVEILIVTGAAGSLREEFATGDIGVLSDHISIPGFSGINPLIGPNLTTFGPRFPALSDAYDYDLRVKAFKAARKLNFTTGSIKEAIYCFLGGPSYETRAEARFLNSMGGDVVGMSTVPEIIVAKHCGIKVLGLILVTNQVIRNKAKSADPMDYQQMMNYQDEKPVNHEEVIALGVLKALDMKNLIKTIIELI